MFLLLVQVWEEITIKKIIINFIKKFNGPIIFDADAISMFKDNKSLIYNLLVKKKKFSVNSS